MLLAFGLLALLSLAPAASADTTHQFLGQLELKGSFGPQPIGVDPDGNIIVWLEPERAVAKYSPTGDPVNFSALGTNKIDGKGTGSCATVPASCDRVPSNGFGTAYLDLPLSSDPTQGPAAMDQSGGPASGYIYVINQSPPKSGSDELFTTYEVFDSSGAYLGQLNDGQAYPRRSPTGPAESLTVGTDGAVYLGYAAGLVDINRCRLDKYVPIDGDPSHTEFAGQLSFGSSYTVNALDSGCASLAGASDKYVYVRGNRGASVLAANLWRKYPQSEFAKTLKPYEFSQAIDFDSANCRCLTNSFAFGDGGLEENVDFGNGGAYFHYLDVDPATDDVYLFDEITLNIEQWSEENERIGPVFGGIPQVDPLDTSRPRWARSFAFDNSGGATDGRIYVKGASTDQLAVFGPPVSIPDIANIGTTPDRESVTVEADIGPAGGPEVESCQIEYGPDFTFGNSVPCEPAVPYTGDTAIATEIGGLTTETDYYYRVRAGSANGVNVSPRFVAHPVAVLDVQTGVATDVIPGSATFNGALDADGLPTEYRFEYGLSTDYLAATPFVDAGSSVGTAAVPPVQITQLQPRKTYHYRLVARNSFGTTYGPDRTVVVPGSPGISTLRATEVTTSSATLNATIDTVGLDTTYQFEYGRTSDYGQTIPVDPASILGSTSPSEVSQHLTGLEEGVTYHFRVSATNQWGSARSEGSTLSFGETACPNSHVRQQTGATHLPDCRAYELVSPGDSAPLSLLPASVLQTFEFNVTEPYIPYLKSPAYNALGLASSPSRFGYAGAIGTLPGLNPPNTVLDRYVATRTTDGWVTTYPGLKGNETRIAAKPECSALMEECLDYDGFDTTGDDPSDVGSRAPHHWSVSGSRLGRLPTNVLEIPGAADRPLKFGVPIEADDMPSADFSHYVFSSINGEPFTSDGKVAAPGSTYDNDVEAKTVTVASRLPGGEDIPQDAGNSNEFMLIPAVSLDGSHILMSTRAPGNTTNLYMRVDGSVSYEVSRGEGVKFVGMTENGDRVVFTTDKQLTPDDTDSSIDLFLWEEQGDQLTRLSHGNGAGDSDACNASWIAQCGVEPVRGEEEVEEGVFRAQTELDDEIALTSGDVYFASPEQLDSSNPGVPGERNLYVYREGEVSYVTTLDPGTKINRVQISPDGRYAAFLTAGRLTAYDNKGSRQAYKFSADSGVLQCVSCLPSGDPPSIPHFLPVLEDVPLPDFNVVASFSGRFMSDDGRIVFATSDALVERDTNELLDVYEFTEGRAQLISSGISQRDTYTGTGRVGLFKPGFIGVEAISRDGRDIYFSTQDTLVSQDKIGSFIKFYDARTNGGFEPEPEFEPCVAADECHGDGVAAPTAPRAGTGGPLGSGGNATQPQRKAKRKKKARKAKRRAQKRKARLKAAARKERSRG